MDLKHEVLCELLVDMQRHFIDNEMPLKTSLRNNGQKLQLDLHHDPQRSYGIELNIMRFHGRWELGLTPRKSRTIYYFDLADPNLFDDIVLKIYSHFADIAKKNRDHWDKLYSAFI